MNIFFIIFLSILYFIYINLIYYFFNQKIMNKKLFYLTLLFCIVNTVIYKNLINIKFLNSLLTLILKLLYCKFILKIDILYNFLFTLTGILTLFLTSNLLIYIITLIPFINKDIFIPNEIIYNTSHVISLIILNILLTILVKNTTHKILFKNIPKKYIKLFIIISCITIAPQFINISLEKFDFNISYSLLCFIQTLFLAYFIFDFIYTSIKKQKTDEENTLLHEELTKLTIINEQTRIFKHDFNNIVSLINGYILLKKYSELEVYIKSLLSQCEDINAISTVNSNVFNHPAIYGVFISKVLTAQNNKIKFNIQSSINYYKINFLQNNLSRIIGILIDNAFEATLKSNSKKYVSYEAYYLNNKTIIKISNTFDNTKNINLDKIFEKGYSNKEIKSGLGLWEVKKIIDETKNSTINTKIEKNIFYQIITIYNN